MARILHVEDDLDWRIIVARELEELGYNFIQFENLDEAKKIFNLDPSKFDCVICDGNLQEASDGLIWAEQLYTSNIKVLVISLNISDFMGFRLPFVDKRNFDGVSLEGAIKKLLNS